LIPGLNKTNIPLPSPLWSIPAITFGLGVWQVNRLYWKLDLIKESQLLALHPPIHLNSLFPSLSTPDAQHKNASSENRSTIPEFTRVLLKGVFDHSKECVVGPRPLADGGNAGTRDPGFRNSGYLIITPLVLSSVSSSLSTSESTTPESATVPPTRILVNRGWLPSLSSSLSSRVDQISDQVEIEAVVRNGEAGSIFMDSNQADRGKWVWIDLQKMAAWTDSMPSFLVEIIKGNI
jgi:surfeit locus 1 family protein